LSRQGRARPLQRRPGQEDPRHPGGPLPRTRHPRRSARLARVEGRRPGGVLAAAPTPSWPGGARDQPGATSAWTTAGLTAHSYAATRKVASVTSRFPISPERTFGAGWLVTSALRTRTTADPNSRI